MTYSIIAGAKASGGAVAPILESIVALASNGLIIRTSSTTVVTRTLTGTANRISITDGDGVAGNPTFDIGSDVVTLAGTQTLSNKTFSTPVLAPYGTNAAPAFSFSADANTGIYGNLFGAPDSIAFSTNGSLRLSITNSSVRAYGIEYTTDLGLYTCIGSVNLVFRSGTTNNILFQNSSSATLMNIINNNVAIGLGSTGGSNRLHVALDDASTNTVLYPLRLDRTSSGTPAAGIGVGIDLQTEYTAGNTGSIARIQALTTALAQTADLTFQTANAGAPAERMRLTSAGRLGIGTTSPNNLLDVAGTAQVDGFRIDQTPTAETIVPTHTITISVDGTNYKIPIVAA